MCFRPKIWAKILMVSALFSGSLGAEPRIDLTEGTLFLTGGADVKYEFSAREPAEHAFKLKIDLGGGYFILDGLAVGLGVLSDWKIGNSDAASLGLKVFSTYFFDTASTIFPYLGGNIVPNWSMREKEFQLMAGIETGVLVSLSESVALDFGLRPEVFFKLYDTQKWKFTLPAGLFGIRAVF